MIKPVLSSTPPRIRLENKPVFVADNLTVEIPRLKHGAVFLTVSNIVTQCAFCEYKLHLDYSRGREIKSFLRDGLEEHKRQLGQTTTNLDFDIEPLPGERCPVIINVGEDGAVYFNSVMESRWILSLREEKILVEPALVVLARDQIPILAQPDMAIFEDERSLILIELKTTIGRTDRLRQTEALQVLLYGLLFRTYGIDVETYIVKMRRGASFVLHRSIDDVLKAMQRARPIAQIRRGVVLHHVDQVPDSKLLENIKHALDYWTYRRNPIAMPEYNKCRICQHSRVCPFRHPLLR